MRYPASEKLEIIQLVEQSHLPVRRSLEQIGIPRSTFYRWCDLYQTGGPEALDDRSPRPDRVWNRIPDDVRARIVTLALDEPELSPRELAVRFTDAERYFVSEASVYRLLKAHDLITSPAFIVMKAADEFKDKTTAPKPALADRLHLSEGDWLGLVLFVDRARRLLPLHRCLEALHHDESRRCHRHLGVGSAGIGAGPSQRGTSASSAIRQRAELRLGGVGGMARQTRHAAYPRRALSSDDTGKDRALASDAQEPHPAGELLSARRARGSDRSLRRPLQSPALPREHRQSDASRCLLRARSNHPAGKRKDQTQNHPTPTLASQNSRSLKSNRMRQTLS